MPHKPFRLARAVQRLRLAQALAHHPLCAGYRAELVWLGRRVKICRGCMMGSAGLLLGTASGLLWPATLPVIVGTLGLGSLFFISSLWQQRRTAKIVTRLLPLAAAAYGIASALQQWPWIKVLLLPAAYVGWHTGAHLRHLHGPGRGPCTNCPQAGAAVCDGFRPYVRTEQLRWRWRA